MGSKPKTSLYVGELEEDATEAVVHVAFIPFGDIKGNATPPDQPTLKHHVFAIITCFKKEDAAAAMDNMHNGELLALLQLSVFGGKFCFMEPWQGDWASWCIGSVFPAPHILTGASANSLGPLLFDGVGKEQSLLSTGSPPVFVDSPPPKAAEQTEDFLSGSPDAFFPEALVEEHLQEDEALKKALIANSSQVLGNRLQVLKCRDGEYAAFFATGKNVDCIGSALCVRHEDSNCQVSDGRINDSSFSPQDVWSTSPSAHHPILQLAAVQKSMWDVDSHCLIAARTMYSVNFYTAHQEEMQVKLTYPMVANFEKCASHVTWNQHTRSEAAVVLDTGEVRLFDLQRGWSSKPLKEQNSYNVPQNCMSSTSWPNILKPRKRKVKVRILKRNKCGGPIDSPFNWWQCEFAWHPKMLLVAGSREVFLMDFRMKPGSVPSQLGVPLASSEEVVKRYNTSLVGSVPETGRSAAYCKHTGTNDTFMSFARSDQDGMYEFCTSTKKHLLLFDTRRPQTSLLQWCHGMEAEPPGLLTFCPISASSQLSEKGNVILAASFKSGNIQAFCYGGQSLPSQPTRSSLAPAMTPSDLDARLYSWQLPSKVFAPHAAPNNWTAVLRSPMNIFQQGTSTAFDLKREHIAGLVLLPEGISKDGQGRGFMLMQLTGEGDIMSQQFRAGEKQWNVGSHGSLVPTCNTATSVSNFKERRRRKHRFLKLTCFSNYMRTGSGLPEEYDSSLSVSNSHLQLESTSVQKYLEVVPPSQPERFLLGLFCKKGRERWKQENCDDPTFLAAQQHLNELVAKTVHYSIVPLSVYEIAHKVLRLGLPVDLMGVAAGMPVDTPYPLHQNCLSTLVWTKSQESFPSNTVISQEISTDLQRKEKGDQKLKESSIPLPVLLQIWPTHALEIEEGSRFGQQIALRPQNAKHLATNGHNAIKNSCEHVNYAIQVLADEGRSSHNSVLSLADPVDSWHDSLTNNVESDRLHIMQYSIPRREAIVELIYGKPFLGHLKKSPFPYPINAVDPHGKVEGLDAENQASSLGREPFCMFVAELEHGSDTSFTGSQQPARDVSHLSPIKLPFFPAGDEVQPEEANTLNSLQTQFKQWLESFVPYHALSEDRLVSI